MKKNTRNFKNGRNAKASKPFQDKAKVTAASDRPAENDFSWYNHNPMLLESASRIQFPYALGSEIKTALLYGGNGTATVTSAGVVRMPGIMSINYRPSIGWSQDVTDPASIAAREMYAKVRKAYSGTLSVDAPDIMMHLLALDSCFAFIAWTKRLYRTINSMSGVNKYTPQALLQAEGFDLGADGANYAKLCSEKTALWGFINTMIADVSKFTCPAVYDLFNRHYWMNDNVYIDRPNRKGQMYVFHPTAYWQFQLDSDSRGMVKGLDTPKLDSFDAIQKFWQTLIGALNNNEDAYTINGYLARAFEGTPNFVIEPLREDDVLNVVYSEEVLSQIHNLKTVGIVNVDVTQDGKTAILYHTPLTKVANVDKLGVTHMGVAYEGIFDMDKELPTGQEIVIASRLMPGVVEYTQESTPSNISKVIEYHGGTELVEDVTIFTANTLNNKLVFASKTLQTANIIVGTSPAVYTTNMDAMWKLSSFYKAPIVQFYYINAAQNDANFEDISTPMIMGELNNVTQVDRDAMSELNRMCIYSEFNTFGV